jgi:hypothetical protein
VRLRFSIRDLLWLTLVVAMGLGWFVHQRQLRAEADDARKWRLAAGGVEEALDSFGLKVKWDFNRSWVVVLEPAGRRVSFAKFPLQLKIAAAFTEPSAPQE